jgi:hypothetical protein
MRDVIEIGTPRLKLRRLRMSDAHALSVRDDPRRNRRLAAGPHHGASRGTDLSTMSQGLIGAIGAHKRGEDGFEMGYWFGRPYWGQGFATEAGTAFVSEAKNLGALNAGHFVDNPASGRVLSKVGFAYTGETLPMFSLGRGESVGCKRMRYAPALERGVPSREAVVMH